MQEQLISLETAKLAKEKGFDEVCAWLYYDPIKIIGTHPVTGQVYTLGLNYCGARRYNFYKNPPKDDINRYHACNQGLLQKWLREVHNCHVEVMFHSPIEDSIDITKDNLRYAVEVNYYGSNFDIPLTDDEDFLHYNIKTYEDALEIGLQEALKLLV